MEIKTLNDIFTVTCGVDRPAVLKSKKNGEWVDVGVPEFRDTVRHVATALRYLGVKPGDRVAILSENRPEWAMGDFAILADGAVTVPIYPTLLAWQIEYIVNDSGSVAVICSTPEQLQKIQEIRDHCPSVHTVLVCDPPDARPENVMTWDELLVKGRAADDAENRRRFDEIRNASRPGDLATLVYTSGTTGNPKGAMLSHGNIASNVLAGGKALPIKTGMIALSILPLSHILERMGDYVYFYNGCTIAYAESVNKVSDNLQEVRPHVFAAVPRLFEKMRTRIMDQVATYPAARQKIFHWALRIAEERLPYRVSGKPMPLGLKVRSGIADKLVFRKILARLGGRVQF
ncbi:MAG TPA: AMP-binding protein, partial [Thermoanaerobaculia bacterium]|nr:AMP-binding protein [Thermoanaerobaculia bacterium]